MHESIILIVFLLGLDTILIANHLVLLLHKNSHNETLHDPKGLHNPIIG